MVADGDGRDPILDAIGSQVDGMVTTYVVVAEYMNSDGDSMIFSDTMETQRCHQTLGLLAFADAIERRRAPDAWDEDDDA